MQQLRVRWNGLGTQKNGVIRHLNQFASFRITVISSHRRTSRVFSLMWISRGH